MYSVTYNTKPLPYSSFIRTCGDNAHLKMNSVVQVIPFRDHLSSCLYEQFMNELETVAIRACNAGDEDDIAVIETLYKSVDENNSVIFDQAFNDKYNTIRNKYL